MSSTSTLEAGEAPVVAGRFVAYLRHFPEKPGKADFALERQRQLVRGFLVEPDCLVEEFVEIETGRKHAERPQLAAALAACRRYDARLVIALLGRIAGNLPIVAGLVESGVDFLAGDNPHASRSTLPLLAAIAEEETRILSARTKAALAVAKARGVKLGNPNGARALRGKQIGNDAAIAAIKSKAEQCAAATYKQIQAIVAEDGPTSLAAISRELNERSIRTPRGGLWYPTSVKLVLDRFKTNSRDSEPAMGRSYQVQGSSGD
jgi:DNA invertase Pin-like site-specific DNA recombinase